MNQHSNEAAVLQVKTVSPPSPDARVSPRARKPAMGKPKTLALSSFILLGVEGMMKLDGQTLRNQWASIGKESTYLGLQRFIEKRGARLPTKLKEGLAEAFTGFPDSTWKATFLRALDGDQDAQASINALGQWSAFRKSIPPSAEAGFSIWIDQMVEIESASQAIDLHLGKNEFVQAAALAAKSLFLHPFLTPTTITRLSNATSAKDAIFPRAAGVCEVLLSQVARVECLTAGWPNFEGGFAPLIQVEEGKPCNPGKQFFACMRGVLGVKTLAEIQDHATRNGVPVIDESTLKRWNSGREFPRAEKLDQVITAVEAHRASAGADAVPSDRIYAQYWAARRLQKLLDLARPPWEAELRLQEASRPWSEMMGHNSAETWIQARYPFWQNHWKQRFPCPSTSDERK